MIDRMKPLSIAGWVDSLVRRRGHVERHRHAGQPVRRLLGPHRRRKRDPQALDMSGPDGGQHPVQLGGRAVALNPEAGLAVEFPVVHAVADPGCPWKQVSVSATVRRWNSILAFLPMSNPATANLLRPSSVARPRSAGVTNALGPRLSEISAGSKPPSTFRSVTSRWTG